jgi:hypothetical protein
MQTQRAGAIRFQSDGRIEGYCAIVSDLASPIERNRNILKLLEAAIAGEWPRGGQHVSGHRA